MNPILVKSGAQEAIYSLLYNAGGGFVTGLTGAQLNMATVMRQSDGKFWNGSGWQPSRYLLAVVEQSAAESPGLHYYLTPVLPDGDYIVRIDTDLAEGAHFVSQLKIGGYLGEILTALAMLKALCGKNTKLFNTQYDANHNLVDGFMRGYASPEDLASNTNPLFEIRVSGTYSGPGEATQVIQKDFV